MQLQESIKETKENRKFILLKEGEIKYKTNNYLNLIRKFNKIGGECYEVM